MYTINLCLADVSAIEFAGMRYEWSIALRGLEEGENKLPESQAWEIVESVINDTDNWRTTIPLLSETSNLYNELVKLYSVVV